MDAANGGLKIGGVESAAGSDRCSILSGREDSDYFESASR